MSYKVQEFLKIRDYQHNDNHNLAEKIDKHDDLLVFFGFRVLDFVCVTQVTFVRVVPQVPLESSLHTLYPQMHI
jgi:hypothetical protein